jgi:hypothetical protein
MASGSPRKAVRDENCGYCQSGSQRLNDATEFEPSNETVSLAKGRP